MMSKFLFVLQVKLAVFKKVESDEWRGITQHDVGILKDIETEYDDDDYGGKLQIPSSNFCSNHFKKLHCCIGLFFLFSQ